MILVILNWIFILKLFNFKHSQEIIAEMENLKEFYDPDTVELMDWINNK